MKTGELNAYNDVVLIEIATDFICYDGETQNFYKVCKVTDDRKLLNDAEFKGLLSSHQIDLMNKRFFEYSV